MDDTTQTDKYEQLYSIRGMLVEVEQRLRTLFNAETDEALRNLQHSAITQIEGALRVLDFVRPDDPAAKQQSE